MAEEVMWAGRFVTAVRNGKWEYVRRSGGVRAVVILAETDDGELLLVEQERIPIGRRCLELPAGLVGDDEGGAHDTIEGAARRELEEETGYRADRIEELGDYYSSPAMVSESFTLVRASGLSCVGEGGGVGGEEITVHRVPREGIGAFVAAQRKRGLGIDVRLLMLLGTDLTT